MNRESRREQHDYVWSRTILFDTRTIFCSFYWLCIQPENDLWQPDTKQDLEIVRDNTRNKLFMEMKDLTHTHNME